MSEFRRSAGDEHGAKMRGAVCAQYFNLQIAANSLTA